MTAESAEKIVSDTDAAIAKIIAARDQPADVAPALEPAGAASDAKKYLPWMLAAGALALAFFFKGRA